METKDNPHVRNAVWNAIADVADKRIAVGELGGQWLVEGLLLSLSSEDTIRPELPTLQKAVYIAGENEITTAEIIALWKEIAPAVIRAKLVEWQLRCACAFGRDISDGAIGDLIKRTAAKTA